MAPPEASIAKLYWGSWHRRLGELAMDVLGPAATVLSASRCRERGYGLDDLQRSFLFSRAETIYGGSNEIQRNIIGERVLGLPPEPKGAVREHRPRRVRSTPATATSATGRPRPPGRARCRGHRGGGHRHRLRHGPALPRGGGGRSSSPTPTSAGWGRRPSSWPREAGSEHVTAIACNVTDEDQVGSLRGRVVARSRPDRRRHQQRRPRWDRPLVDMTDEQWSTVLDITLTGTFRCIRAALRHMLPRTSGVIVNNASVLGWRAQADQAHYAAAKAGVMALTRCAAAEAAP